MTGVKPYNMVPHVENNNCAYSGVYPLVIKSGTTVPERISQRAVKLGINIVEIIDTNITNATRGNPVKLDL